METEGFTLSEEERLILFDEEKAKAAGEEIATQISTTAGKAGEVIGDLSKIAIYGSALVVKSTAKTSSSFVEGFKKGWKK